MATLLLSIWWGVQGESTPLSQSLPHAAPHRVRAKFSMLPRDLAKTESDSDPAFDGVVHISASDSCTNNASILNDALHKIFPSHAAIPPTAVVAVLEDDQASQ